MILIPSNTGSGLTPKSWSYVDSSISDLDSVSYPATTQSGDLLLYFDGAAGQSVNPVGPVGWNEIAKSSVLTSAGTYANVGVYWLLATSSSGSVTPNYTPQSTSAGQRRKILLCFRPSQAVSVVNVHDVASTIQEGDSVPQEITVNHEAPILCIAHGRRFGSMSTTWPSGMTRVVNGTGHTAAYAIQNTSVSNISIPSVGFSLNYSGIQSFYLIGLGD